MSVSSVAAGLLLAAGFAGAALLCPLCDEGSKAPDVQTIGTDVQAPDTATVRLHISGMTCGSCPVTARTALRRLQGVFSAAVTLEDSLGIVRYDPRKLTPAQIGAHLTRLTGYGARVLPDTQGPPAGASSERSRSPSWASGTWSHIDGQRGRGHRVIP